MHKLSKAVALPLLLSLVILSSSLIIKPATAQNSANPLISILYPTNETFFNVSIEGVYFQLLYQTNETLSWVGYSVNGGGNVTCTGNTTDNTAFIKDGYQFIFGKPVLTLYANDTAGNWAAPQTVTYTVYFYPDSTPAPSSPSSIPSAAPSLTASLTPSAKTEANSSNPTPLLTSALTPAAPEFSLFVILPFFLSMLSIVVILGHRKTTKINQ